MGRDILRSIFSVFGANLGSLLITMIVTPLFSRFLGSSGYGEYGFLVSLYGILFIVASPGISGGIRKYVAEDRGETWTEEVFGFYVQVAVLLVGIVSFSLVLFAFSGTVVRYFNPDYRLYLLLLSLWLFSGQIFAVGRSFLMGLGLEHQSEPPRLIQRLIFGALSVFMIYSGFHVAGVLAAHIISTALLGLIVLHLCSKKINLINSVLSLPQNLPRKELLSFNVYSIILIALISSLYHVDILLIRSLLGSTETGNYKAALVIAEFLWFLPIAIQSVFVQSMSELWDKGKTNRISEISSRTSKFTLLITLLLAIGIGTLASDFVPFYFGTGYEQAVIPLLILLPGTLGFAISRPILAVGQGKGELRILTLYTAVASTINLFLNLVLIPLYGIAGAAVATSIGYGLMVILHVNAARQIGFDPIKGIFLKRTLTVGGITSVVLMAIISVVQSSTARLMIIPPMGLFTYGILSWRLGLIAEEDVNMLLDYIDIKRIE